MTNAGILAMVVNRMGGIPVIRAFAFSLLSCLAIGVVHAEAAPDLTIRFPSYRVSYAVNGDGSFTETRYWEKTILKQTAVSRAKQTAVTFSTSIQTAEVIDAYTRKADGRRIDSPKSNFQVETNTGKEKDAPVFSDQTTVTTVFPEVEVGDTVVFSYRLTAREPMFPGHFSVAEVYPRTVAYDDVNIRIDAPAALWAQYEARQLTALPVLERDGRRILEWTYQNRTPVVSKRRNYSVYDVDKDPGFAFSTYRDYAAIAAAYGERAVPKAAVTARVRKLAEEIAGDRKAPRDIARAFYDWVAVNISYAGNCIGIGAVLPHDIDFILDNRMGDCKDHATLLQALLAAKGIASTQALVNANNVYKLPKIPVASIVNHVINYIPAFDLYADSTSSSTPFGLLPFGDADKPVLLVDGHRADNRTPPNPMAANQQIMKTVASVDADGSVRGEVQVSLKGMWAAESRDRMRRLSKSDEEDIVQNVFKRQGYIASGSFEKDDPKDLLDSHRYGARFEVKNLLPPGPGAFAIAPMFFSEAPVGSFIVGALQEDSIDDAGEDGTCHAGRSVEEYRYTFPKGMKILAVPDDFRVANDFSTYTATYRLKGRTLEVRRVIEDRTRGHVCSAAVFAAEREFARKALPNLKAQVLYK